MKKLVCISLVLFSSIHIFSQSKDYQKLHSAVIKFYGYQRAGLKSGDCYNLNSGYQAGYHKGDSYNGNQLDAGWYDAGDYIKFGMNLGYTVYCLLKGYDVFSYAYDDQYSWNHSATKDGIPDILNQVKHATDYMMHAVINENTVVLDVGKAQDEHEGLDAPMKNASGRSGNLIGLCDGADVPLMYAACLALMSTVYKKFDSNYADECLAKAKAAFEFGKSKYDGKKFYCTPQLKNEEALYDYPKKEENKKEYAYRIVDDKLMAAGVELYRATNNEDPVYEKCARISVAGVSNCMGYAYIGPLASYEVKNQGLSNNYSSLSSSLAFINTKIKSSGKFSGVYQNSGWGTARDMGTVAFEYALGYIFATTDDLRDKYESLIRKHVDWVAFGSQSYIVGFGNNSPKSIHYRPTRSGPTGGIVSGPDGDGNWQDDSKQAKYTEVAIDYNAGMVGAVAFLRALDNPPSDVIQLTNSFSATPKTDVNLSTGNVTFSATFSKSVKWEIVIKGCIGEKKLTGSGTSINEKWDGSADKGLFLAGEIVNTNLKVTEAVIAVTDRMKILPVSLEISSVKKASSGSKDIKFDDFEDGDLINTIKGNWIANGTGTGIRSTKIAVEEDEGSKALEIRINSATNATETYSGVRATFNNAGSAVSIGASKSIVFDLKAEDPVNFYVELEQANITDGAYYCVLIPVTTYQNRYRVSISDLKQHDWKEKDAALDLTKITALRFTTYDSIRTSAYLDNVLIEDFSTAVLPYSVKMNTSNFKFINANGNMVYSIPQNMTGVLNISVFDVSGKMVVNRVVNNRAGNTVTVPFSGFPNGVYTIVNTMNGKIVGENRKFINAN